METCILKRTDYEFRWWPRAWGSHRRRGGRRGRRVGGLGCAADRARPYKCAGSDRRTCERESSRRHQFPSVFLKKETPSSSSSCEAKGLRVDRTSRRCGPPAESAAATRAPDADGTVPWSRSWAAPASATAWPCRPLCSSTRTRCTRPLRPWSIHRRHKKSELKTASIVLYVRPRRTVQVRNRVGNRVNICDRVAGGSVTRPWRFVGDRQSAPPQRRTCISMAR